MKKEYIRIFKDKNGEFDFGISGNIREIKSEELARFRSIVVTAIYVAEDMWRREQNNDADCVKP